MQENSKLNIAAKSLSIATVVLLICSLAVLILYMVMPALVVAEDSFAGWEISFYGPAENFAYGQYNFGYNVTAIVAFVLALIVIVAMLIVWRKANRIVKCVFGAVILASFVFAAAVLLNIGSLAESVASPDMGATIGYAQADGLYHTTAMPVLAAVVCLLTAVAGAADIAVGVFEKLGLIAVKEREEDEPEDAQDETDK